MDRLTTKNDTNIVVKWSKTMSTWCLDMGDNLNANGAAPVALYVCKGGGFVKYYG